MLWVQEIKDSELSLVFALIEVHTYLFEHSKSGAKPHNPVGDIKEVILEGSTTKLRFKGWVRSNPGEERRQKVPGRGRSL